MGTHYDLPRIGDSANETLSDAEAVVILGQIAENLEAAQGELGQIVLGRITGEEIKQNTMHAAVAQAHALQAIGTSFYLLLAVNGADYDRLQRASQAPPPKRKTSQVRPGSGTDGN